MAASNGPPWTPQKAQSLPRDPANERRREVKLNSGHKKPIDKRRGWSAALFRSAQLRMPQRSLTLLVLSHQNCLRAVSKVLAATLHGWQPNRVTKRFFTRLTAE